MQATNITVSTVEQVRALLTTADDFRNWLLSVENRYETVGESGSYDSSPIVVFLEEQTNLCGFVVTPSIIEEWDHSVVYFSNGTCGNCASAPIVPDWLQTFVEHLDELDHGLITPDCALHILDEVSPLSASVIENTKIEAVPAALTVEQFRDWLLTAINTQRDKVGVTGDHSNSPLALYLIEATGIEDIKVLSDTIKHYDVLKDWDKHTVFFSNGYRGNGGAAPNVPNWVTRFVEELDNHERDHGYGDVTPEWALELLDRIVAEIA